MARWARVWLFQIYRDIKPLGERCAPWGVDWYDNIFNSPRVGPGAPCELLVSLSEKSSRAARGMASTLPCRLWTQRTPTPQQPIRVLYSPYQHGSVDSWSPDTAPVSTVSDRASRSRISLEWRGAQRFIRSVAARASPQERSTS